MDRRHQLPPAADAHLLEDPLEAVLHRVLGDEKLVGIGTFSVFVVTPDVAFQATNPLLLSTEGEFVMKNLVLVAAAIALVRTPRSRRLQADI